MKIYFDGLFYKGSGIGRYYESILKELDKKDIKIYTAIPKRLAREFEKNFHNMNNIKPIFVNYEKFSVKGFFNHSFILKSLEKVVDIFFFPHLNLPYYIPNNTIITIHDLRPFTQYWDRSIIKLNVFKFFLYRSLKYSKKIICISKTVESELYSFSQKSVNKTHVIYEYVNDKFLNSEKKDKRIINKPYMLFVGNRKKHKNIGLLIKAFSDLKNLIPHNLVIAGSKESIHDEVDILKEKLHLKDRIIELINPDDDTLINLYTNADLFVFPSLFEGFGLPPLESVASGCPAVVSDIPIFKEIFGNSSLYFNPYNKDDLSNVMLNILNNIDIKNNLINMQKERLKFFNKEKIVNQYISVFNEIINAGNK